MTAPLTESEQASLLTEPLPNNSKPSLPRVGARFSRGAERGTVRYVGRLPSTDGTWLGVEWDDASKGKHDGVHNGVPLFECRQPGAGSFLRPTRKLSYGTSFLNALRSKYVADASFDPVDFGEQAAHRYTRKNLADIALEAPNMDGVLRRVARLDRLREVALDGWRVNTSGDSEIEANDSYAEVAFAYDASSDEEGPGCITKTCPNIRWLDLSRSLLPTWHEVARIAAELPDLETLVLHWNRFDTLQSIKGSEMSAFGKVKDLRLDGTWMTWDELSRAISVMPRLEVLQVGFNGLGNPRQPLPATAAMTSLTMLNLEDNLLSDWPHLANALSVLPKLERLILTSNSIPTIPLPQEGDRRFPSLKHISISDNPISAWSDLDALSGWVDGGIQSLVISGDECPLVSALDPRDVRLIATARLASLTSFNHGHIQPAERRDAELYYLSFVEKHTVGMADDARSQLHPRWAQLVKQHGRSPDAPQQPSTDGGHVSTSTLRSKLLRVRVHLASASPSKEAPFITAPLPLLPDAAPAAATPQASPPSFVDMDLLTTTPIRLLQGKLARSLGLRARGGVRAIVSLWALLSPHIDPDLDTAVHLRQAMRPNEVVVSIHQQQPNDDQSQRIVYELDSLERDLAGYNFTTGDELVVVIREEAP